MSLNVIKNSASELGESPVWDPRLNCLYWLDILKGEIFSWAANREVRLCAKLPYSVGSLALTDNEDILLLATEKGFAFYDLNKASIEFIADPEKHLVNNRFNDGKCDPRGRYWAGTMAKDGQGKCGHLYCLASDGSIEKKLSEVNCSNGLVWSKSQDKMYYIDTGRHCIDSFDYDVTSGEIKKRRTIFRMDAEQGFLDGMTIDEEGRLWVAVWGGGCVICVDPEKEAIVERILLPVSQVTCCTFGGENLSTLFISSASLGLAEQDKKKQDLGGHIFTYEMSVKGFSSDFYPTI